MKDFFEQMIQIIAGYVPNLLGALAILIIGWLVAMVISAIIRAILRRTSLAQKLSGWISGKDDKKPIPFDSYISKAVFYLLMVFVLIAFFQALGLTLITEPLNNLLNQVFVFAPRFLGATLLLVLAWVLASLLKFLLRKSLSAMNLDEQIGSKMDEDKDKKVNITDTFSNAVYWLVFLLFLPAVLNTLEMKGLLEPVQSMLDKILLFLPNIFTAGIILLVGWFVAGIIRKVVTNLLATIGTDTLSEKAGLSSVLGKEKLSGIIGLLLYIFILIPVIIATLDALALEAVTNPVSNMLNIILLALPNIFAAAVVIVIAYLIGKFVGVFVTNILKTIGFNKFINNLGIIKESKDEKKQPAYILGYALFVAIVFLASIEALQLLGFELVSDLARDFTMFAGNIVIGLLIFTLGLFLANFISNKILSNESSQSKLFSLITRIAIIFLSSAMALQQMGFGEEIINLAFGLVLGAIAVALAISFGVGGKEIATRSLEGWLKKME